MALNTSVWLTLTLLCHISVCFFQFVKYKANEGHVSIESKVELINYVSLCRTTDTQPKDWRVAFDEQMSLFVSSVIIFCNT